jgi:hypothetical protein
MKYFIFLGVICAIFMHGASCELEPAVFVEAIPSTPYLFCFFFFFFFFVFLIFFRDLCNFFFFGRYSF